MERIAWAAAAALLALSTAAGQPPPEEPILAGADAELALAVAKVAANEASLSAVRPADVAMIWQVAEGHGETSEERLDWLRRHCRCVLGSVAPEDRPRRERPPRGSNCWWSWHLRDGDERPAGWSDRLPWESFGAGRWADVRRHAARHVAGTSTVRRPCRVRPWTWGGPRWDQAAAARRQLVRVDCIGTRNWGYIPMRQLVARDRLRARARALLSDPFRSGT